MFKRYFSACGIVHGNQNDALHRFCSQIQFLCALLLLHRCNNGGIFQTWEAPTQQDWQNHALFHEKEWEAVLVVGQAYGGKKNFQSTFGWLQT